MAYTRRITLPESTYRHLLGCKNEITDLFLRKFSCEVELRGPEPSKSHAASVKDEKVYEKRTLGGPIVSVWKGDLTKQDADVVVNAANESLDHAGGLARALAEAGGPIIEKDSKDYIKANGKIKTGECAVTRAGNLPCKCLLHVVGPVWFQDIAKRCEYELAESIKNVLKYVNHHKEYKSVAIPAVSSGIFGFPVQQCADIIVEIVRSFCFNVKETHLKEIRLVNNNDPAIQAMKSACEKSFGPSDDLSGATSSSSYQTGPMTRSMSAKSQPSPMASSNKNAHGQPSARWSSTETSQSITINGLTLHLVHGLIEEQKTQIIVNSISSNLDLYYGVISRAIVFKAGNNLQDEIIKKSSYLRTTKPNTDITMIPTKGFKLSCEFVYHVILPPASPTSYQRALQVLSNVTSECLQTAHRYKSHSISFPALGTGNIGLPKDMVSKVMTETVLHYARVNQCQLDVYFVIHPDDKGTYQEFRYRLDLYRTLVNSGPTMEARDPRPDLHGASSNSRDSEIPCLIINAASDEDSEEAEAWLRNVLQPQPISIDNNLILLLGQEEHDLLSSPDFPDVIIEEKLSNGKSLLEIDGLPQDKVKGVIQAERLLLDVQEKHAVTLEEELLEEAVVWLYENESGAQKYLAKANREIEKAFVAQRDLTLNSDPHHFISIANLMAEGKGGAFRLQRRALCNGSKDVQKRRHPDDWLASVVPVDPKSQVFQDQTNKFKKDKLVLIKMEKIQNRYLSEIFQYKKGAKMSKKTGQLYQVVPKQFTRLVCDVGFQRIFSNPIDLRNGQGIYFTDGPRRALEFFQTPKEEGGLICIFQAEVLTDNPAEGRRDLPVLVPKKAPLKSKPDDIMDLCDNLVNSKMSPTIYVIPDSFQANPQYLFTCRRQGSGSTRI